MSEPGESTDERVQRLRALALRLLGRIGGLPAVGTLGATLEAYDKVGGGLVAGGLAYAALIALLPGLLLALSVLGVVVDDPATRERIVEAIAEAVPPLEELVRVALEQVSAGAVPTGIIAVIGLLWGSSRFYASLDYAFARLFHEAPRRNEIVRTLRGLAVTGLLVALPIVAVIVGVVASRLIELAPDRVQGGTLGQVLLRAGTPLGSVILFVGTTLAVYRQVPAVRPPAAAYRLPAVLVGIALAGFTQLFALVAPLMFRMAALFGTLVTAFALLAWLSISFNMLLLGAAWMYVRAQRLAMAGDAVVATPSGAEAPRG